jgi:hypothetical protein
MFPVRYELKLYTSFRINFLVVLKGLIPILKVNDYSVPASITICRTNMVNNHIPYAYYTFPLSINN